MISSYLLKRLVFVTLYSCAFCDDCICSFLGCHKHCFKYSIVLYHLHIQKNETCMPRARRFVCTFSDECWWWFLNIATPIGMINMWYHCMTHRFLWKMTPFYITHTFTTTNFQLNWQVGSLYTNHYKIMGIQIRTINTSIYEWLRWHLTLW